MTRENAAAKGRRYLIEGRVTVRSISQAGVVATVRGDNALTYRAEWNPDTGWHCNCPAFSDQCAHLVALRLITVVNERTNP